MATAEAQQLSNEPQQEDDTTTILAMDTAGEPACEMRFEVRDGIEMVPGTVHLVDVQGNSDLKHQKGHNDVVLIPQPSNDPDDPLNWSTLRKEGHFWQLILWAVLMAASVNWSGPVWVPLQNDLHTTLTDMNISAALCFGFLGIGGILLQPTAMKIGRRPVYFLGTLLSLVGCIIGGVQQSIQVYYLVNILTGFGAAPVDSLVQISTTDLFFAHERGTRLSYFALALGLGTYMGPVAAGYVTESQDSQGWRLCFWVLAGLFGGMLLLQAFSLEESVYQRPTPVSRIDPAQVELQSSEEHKEAATHTIDTLNPPKTILPSTNTFSNPPKTYWQRLNPLQIIRPKNTNSKPWWMIAWFPFTLFQFPAIVWVGILSGIQIMWVSLLSVTQSDIFGNPPYNFSIATVGDTNIAAFIGGIFGMIWGGPLSDWYVLRTARNNKGIMEPESRLWLLIVPAFLNSGGLLMYGLGAYRGLHWIISAGFGTGLIGFGIGSGAAICITYAIDAYPDIAAESMVLILFLRNVIGFLFTFVIQPWIDGLGGQTTLIMLACICLVFTLSFIIMVKWGKRFRAMTATKYLRYTETR